MTRSVAGAEQSSTVSGHYNSDHRRAPLCASRRTSHIWSLAYSSILMRPSERLYLASRNALVAGQLLDRPLGSWFTLSRLLLPCQVFTNGSMYFTQTLGEICQEIVLNLLLLVIHEILPEISLQVQCTVQTPHFGHMLHHAG
jgi:hypothetical protein